MYSIYISFILQIVSNIRMENLFNGTLVNLESFVISLFVVISIYLN